MNSHPPLSVVSSADSDSDSVGHYIVISPESKKIEILVHHHRSCGSQPHQHNHNHSSHSLTRTRHSVAPCFSSLPFDVSIIAFSYLAPRDLSTCFLLSRAAASLASDSELWIFHCRHAGWRPNAPLERVSAMKFYLRRRRCIHSTLAMWDRLQAYLPPAVRGSFNIGASDKEISHAENRLKIIFPEELRSSLRLFDGQLTETPLSDGLLFGCRLLSVKEIVEETELISTSPSLPHEWLCVTSLAGHQRFCLRPSDGSVWLISGISLDQYLKGENWTRFIEQSILPPALAEFN